MPLRTEILLTLIVKTAVLFLLWQAFFSDPVDEHLDEHGVAEALLQTHKGTRQ